MSTLEIVLNMLAEASTTGLSKRREPGTFPENLAVAREGGEVAGVARRELEMRSGQSVITSQNAAQLNQVVTDMIEGMTKELPTKTPDKPDQDE